MPTELLVFLVMIVAFAGAVFWLKIPSGVALALAAFLGALASGEGIPVRHLVEGMFGYFDAVVIIATAMIFMKAIEASGALGTISHVMIRSLHGRPTLLMIFIMVFVMFPGMLTGLSSVCILTTGALVAPAMLALGMPRTALASFLAIGGVLGMIAPPINIPVMIIGGGVDMPYIGFEQPLLLATGPLALGVAVYYRFRYRKSFRADQLLHNLPTALHAKHGLKLFLPLVIVIGLMAAIRIFPHWIPDIGIPLIFVIGTLATLGTGERIRLVPIARDGVRDALPVMSILVGVGMFVQIMTLTGVRGFLAVSALQVPSVLLFLAIAMVMPAFGSAYASASVVGIPFLFAFLGQNEIVIASALSLIAGLGDMMPPPLLVCVLGGQVVGEERHFRILKESLIPILAAEACGILMIAFSRDIGAFLGIN
jgi:TRAP-type C4-dicarboxylate transport system permease large subunit